VGFLAVTGRTLRSEFESLQRDERTSLEALSPTRPFSGWGEISSETNTRQDGDITNKVAVQIGSDTSQAQGLTSMGRCPSSLAALAFPPRKQGGKRDCAGTSGHQGCAAPGLLWRDLAGVEVGWGSPVQCPTPNGTVSPPRKRVTKCTCAGR
jgi:hypothetical protein